MPILNTLPDTFSAALRLLRKRARLTQDELGRAVGYSREQIARLENGSRLPDLAVIAALFVPVLFRTQRTAPSGANVDAGRQNAPRSAGHDHPHPPDAAGDGQRNTDRPDRTRLGRPPRSCR